MDIERAQSYSKEISRGGRDNTRNENAKMGTE